MRASVSTSWLVGAGISCAVLFAPSTAVRAQYGEPADRPVTHIDDAPDDAPKTKPSKSSSGAPPPPPEPAAGSEEADREARALFEQGRIAFEEGRYRDSWDYFHRAYSLSRRPKLLYNVGQAADRLRKDREALEAFRLYLKHVPDAENRQEVEARVRALEAQLEAEGGPSEDELDDESGDRGPEYVREGTEDETATPRTEGQPTRTGWYLRLAGGLGLMSDSVSGSLGDGTLSSLTAAGEVGVGYPVLEELVVGGMLIFDVGLAPKFEGAEVDSARLGGIGAFVDYYFDPRNHGWHAGGGIVLAQLAKKQSAVGTGATAGSDPAAGLALVASGGYEWAVSDQWAIGPVGRITLAKLTEESFDHTAFVLSLMFGATWF